MKNLFKILLGLFLIIFAISCSKDEGAIIVPENQGVVFDITNFVPQNTGKDIFVGKDNGENDPLIPDCSDLEPSYVIINIDGTDYTLQLVTLNNKTETEVLKLAEGQHFVNEFIVYAADGTAIWASPFMGSYYQVLWQLRGVNELPFTVAGFDKLKVELDVLCYRPFDYERFGFAWFAYSKIEIHTVCFFGDICTKFFDEWHLRTEGGNPYLLQDYDGYDFPAIFSVKVFYEDSDVLVNDLELNSNAGWYGIGAPLCIEYPDQVEVENEVFAFEIWLAMPDGTDMLIYEGQFNDTAMAEIGNPDGFGGADGIFDFVVGNCSYDGNDANLELLPWIPVPETADMDALLAAGEQYLINVKFRQGTVLPAPIPSIIEEEVWYNTLCGEEFVGIPLPDAYAVEFYSSMDRNLPGSNFPAEYMGYPWGSINYIANECEAMVPIYGWSYVQEALWYIINPGTTSLGVNNQLAQDAAVNSSFIPTVGDYACVLIEPVARISVPGEATKLNAPEGFQLLLLRVDP